MQNRKIAVEISVIKDALKDLQKDKKINLSEMKKAFYVKSYESMSRYYHLKSFVSGLDMGIQKLKSIIRTAECLKREIKEDNKFRQSLWDIIGECGTGKTDKKVI